MNKPFSRWQTSALLLAVLGCVVLSSRPAYAGGDSVPDWFRQLAHAPLPTYSSEANAAVLLDEETVTVKDNGEMYKTMRRVVKILRPDGKSEGTFGVSFDKDRKILSMRGWTISASGQEYELKDKDAIETSYFSDEMYSDVRYKAMKVPAADVGAFVAYEYQQRCRPEAYSEIWGFQEENPVHSARFTLNLPTGWEYQYHFGNWVEQKPKNLGGNNWEWEVHDVPEIEQEAEMPSPGAIAGMMAINLYSTTFPRATRMSDWNQVAAWANSLNSIRRVPTAKLQAKAAELTAGQTDTLAKIRAISSYVQHNIRYVAIKIGKVGGWQAHMAGDTFANGYGDCKDKATLLITMLHEAGIEAYFTLVYDERGVVNPDVPTPWTFDHAIVAVKLPANTDTNALYGVVRDDQLGTILFFDPTNDAVPFGMVPGYEQNGYALVVNGNAGKLVRMPVVPPSLNRLLRIAHFTLTPEGGLIGDVQEIHSGDEAAALRARLNRYDRGKQAKYFESFLSEYVDHSQITYAAITGLDKFDEPLILHYKFLVGGYAKSAGDLLLVRPQVIGEHVSSFAEQKKQRKYAVSYPSTWSQSDVIDIKLPAGYKVDELPGPVDVKVPFAEYRSKTEVKDNILYYNQTYERKDLTVPLDQFATLRTFLRGVAADGRNTAVLKRTQP